MTANFNKFGYQIVEQAIDKKLAMLLSTEFTMLRDVWYYSNNVDVSNIEFCNDRLVNKCFAWGSAYCFEALLLLMLPTVEAVTGKKLFPSHSYARIYYHGAEMPAHTDRPSCQYSATMTLDIDQTPWEIYFKDMLGNTTPIILNTGDMCVYQGTKLEHWRTPYQGQKQVQVFLHYVDQNGEYADFKYDKRPMLGVSNDRR